MRSRGSQAAAPGPPIRDLGAVAVSRRRVPAGPAPPSRRLPRGRDVGGEQVGVGVRQQRRLHPPRAQHLPAEAAAQHGHAAVLEGAAAGGHGGWVSGQPRSAPAPPPRSPGPVPSAQTATLPPVSLNSRPQPPIGRGRPRPANLIGGDQGRGAPLSADRWRRRVAPPLVAGYWRRGTPCLAPIGQPGGLFA